MSDRRHPRRSVAARHRGLRRTVRVHGSPITDGAGLATLPPMIRISRCVNGKLRYFERADAELALAGMDRHDRQRRECRVYSCRQCGGWHLTSIPPFSPNS